MCMLPAALEQVKPNPPTKPQWPRPVRHRMIQLASVIDYAIEVCRDLAATSCSLV
jgi:hypothetical protein